MPYAAFWQMIHRARTNSCAGEMTNASLRIRSTTSRTCFSMAHGNRASSLRLVDTLIDAGADLDFQRNAKGDTPLIGAAGLGAEEVRLRLIDAGAGRNSEHTAGFPVLTTCMRRQFRLYPHGRFDVDRR